jgi:AraC-like DNA-binding protein
MATRTAVTPIAFARCMVQAYRQAGRDPAEALRQARITPAQLRDPAARISAAQMETLSAAAMQALDDEALGWFGRRLPWGSHGMLVRASLTAPTLGLALARWCRHHGLLVDDVRLVLERDGGLARVRIEEHRPLGAFREFCLVTLLRQVHGVACWWVDARIPLAEAAFPFAAPPHADAYGAMFPGPVRFGAGQASLAFEAAWLAEPMRRDEAALRQMLQRGLAITVLPYRRERLLAQRVRTLLATRVAELRDAAAVAAALHVSPRTLHRQLRAEGTSLQALKDEARRTLAEALLQRTQRPVKQVAQAAGFRSEKSFARAFRQWTGTTPAELRRGSPQP